MRVASASGLVHEARRTRRIGGYVTLACDGRSVRGYLRVVDDMPLTCKRCTRQSALDHAHELASERQIASTTGPARPAAVEPGPLGNELPAFRIDCYAVETTGMWREWRVRDLRDGRVLDVYPERMSAIRGAHARYIADRVAETLRGAAPTKGART